MRFKSLASLVMSLSVSAFLSSAAYSQNPSQSHNGKAEVTKEVKHDISPPLRDLPSVDLDRDKDKAPHEHPVKPIPQPDQKTTPSDDKGLQAASVGPLVAATPITNFDGVGIPNYGVNAAPPDTNGAVGATQYVQWVNEAFAVFDKATGAMLPGYPKNGNTLWAGFGGPCETSNDGDPIVQYDKIANRWVLTQFAVSTTPYRQCVAVSTTPDAGGTYARYEFTYGTDFNDYPKVGVWPDGYYITYNIFANAATFKGAKVCAYDRVKMLAGQAATQQCFQLSTSFGGLLPSDLDGASATLGGPGSTSSTGLPPAGSPNYLVNFGSNSLNVWKFHVDWATPANTTLTGPTNIPVNAFTRSCSGGACIPQPGTSQQLDSLADRLMYRLAYRNFGSFASIVVNHTVQVGTNRKNITSGIRWYELRVTNGNVSVNQQGTYSPNSNFRWMGSMAMDKKGNIGLGYSISSSTMFPSVFFTGRSFDSTFSPGVLEAETSIFGGSGAQQRNLNRWGDYSSLSVDPVDDCTMWFTTEYLKQNGTFNWSTRIGKIKFDNCQ
ncbi:MAG TPA: hypothetical protein VF762_04850 [Blastocatellia bacterium]